MRRVVVSQEASELELRPPELVERYRELSEREAVPFFQGKPLVEVPCPFCETAEVRSSFGVWGFQYRECSSCGSLYVSPRPAAEHLAAFRRSSESGAFWRGILDEIARERYEKVMAPRLQWLCDVTAEHFQSPVALVDLGGLEPEPLAELTDTGLFATARAVAPEDSTKPLEPESAAQVASAFDLLNRSFSPRRLLSAARRMLAREGLLFLSGRGLGFETQILWERPAHLHPIDHLNLPSTEALERSLVDNGFELLELSTPGQLDLEMVASAAERDGSLVLPRWLSYLIARRGKAEHEAFQEFLQRARLSSHFRVAAQRRAGTDEGTPE